MAAHPRLARLDGLRGIAVLVVIIYHAWPDALPGGWIGVSLFFTLSGYLISGQLPERGVPGSLTAFWRKRARRLLPALLVTVVATTILVFAVAPEGRQETAQDGVAALAYVHNWWSIHTTGGYWEIFDSTPRPLAHLWSLAIEEQTYVIWPLAVLWLGLRRALVAGALVSAIGIWWWWGSADAYYATPVRFLEILGGAALVLVFRLAPSWRIPGVAGAVAASVVGVLVVTLSESSDWVGTGALAAIAVASTVLIGAVIQESMPTAGLAARPLVWLGLRSYGIYLIHWPLLVLLNVKPIVALTLALVLAEVSYRTIEMPIRTGQWPRRPLIGLVGASVTCAIALMLIQSFTAPETVDVEAATADALAEADTSTTLPTVADPAAADPPTLSEAQTPTTEAPRIDPPRIRLGANPTAIVVGDSTGQAVEPAIRGWIEANGGSVLPGARVSCGPLFDATNYADWSAISYISGEFGPLDEPCRPTIDPSVDLVLVIDHGVALMDHRNQLDDQLTNITEPPFHDLLVASYERLIADAAAADAVVVFLTAPQSLWPIDGTDDFYPTKDRLESYRTLVYELAATHEHVYVLDVGPVIEAQPDRYPRSDSIHLDADSGAIHLVVDLLAPVIVFDSAP